MEMQSSPASDAETTENPRVAFETKPSHTILRIFFIATLVEMPMRAGMAQG
jgi:hypothetical protein